MTILPTSPTPKPSTYTLPACTLSASRPLRPVNSNICPFSPIKILSRFTPKLSAISACLCSMRYSPCIGIKKRGRISDNIIFNSSCEPWPDTWTFLSEPCTTCAPSFTNLSIVSLPGIGDAERITVSFGWIWICRCAPSAIRERPAIGSPWLPVVKMQS